VLTTRENAIIALLAAGRSEEFTATELGISRRTVIYALRGLMDRIGVDNRFQLALILGAHGTAPLSPVLPHERPDGGSSCDETSASELAGGQPDAAGQPMPAQERRRA
jgi:DNA-binding CsgD family transcriptional regulator